MSNRPLAQALLLAAALLPGGLAYAAMLGLGLHRHAPPWAVSVAATTVVFGPPLLASALANRSRAGTFGLTLTAWSLAVLIGMPVYFPGERRQAIASGIALFPSGSAGERLARRMADALPDEPDLSRPELPVAEVSVLAEHPDPRPLEPHEIALPFEGSGRRLAVPVVFQHDGQTIETWMMLDTGATYTTLPPDVLDAIGLGTSPAHPRITLHTANGEREAEVVLVDQVWLGDLSIEGVAIATCDACASSDTVGLLGLNVTGGYNLFIDADRREVVFSSREARDQRLDVSPFVDLSASFTRFPGGRIEVEVELQNQATRPIASAAAAVSCGISTWVVPIDTVAPGQRGVGRRRLPEHDPCEKYQVALDEASW